MSAGYMNERDHVLQRRDRAVQGSARLVACAVALVFLVVGIADHGNQPHWPLLLATALLGLGLVAGPVAGHLVGRSVHRPAQTVAAVAALIALVAGLSSAPIWASKWPELDPALILGAGLAVGPFVALVRERSFVRSAPLVASTGALVIVVVAIADGVDPHWPLMISAVLLGAAVAVEPLVPRVADRAIHAQTVSMAAALFVLVLGLASAPYWVQRWPELAPAAILGTALALGPAAQLWSRRSAAEFARLTSVVGALVVVVIGIGQGIDPGWPLTIAALLLGLGLVVGPLAQRIIGQSVRRSAESAATVAALVVLILGLSSAPYWTPRWPELLPALVLGIGLAAEYLLAWLGVKPRETVLTARVDQLSRTRHGALDVQASELRRIERDLHDGAQVRLVALSMKLGRAEERYRDDAATAALLREAREDATAAIRELRELARGIAPPVLSDRGLVAAVHSLAQRSGAEVKVSGDLAARPLPTVESAAYFVVAESLTNAVKHAPGAPVEVRLDERGGDLFVEITDFGPGGADPAGSGLTGLRQRVEALDGDLHVTSPAGVGTQVEAVLPGMG